MLVVTSWACGSKKEATSATVVVNAPVAGRVKRVMVIEGVSVDAGTPIVEIALESIQPAAAPTTGETVESVAVRKLQAANAEVSAARAEVVKHQAEVQRLTALVPSGQESQAALDGEQALYERAQQRLQKAQEAVRVAQTELLAARQPGKNPSPPPPVEQIVTARTPTAGKVSEVNVRVGDHVTGGQSLATLTLEKP